MDHVHDALDAKSTNVLSILKNEVEVARLKRTKDGCIIDLAERIRIPSDFDGKLTYRIDLRNGPYETKGVNLAPYFAGLLPEGLRLKALVRRAKTSEDDLFSLLVASGTDPVGDLHFRAPFGDAAVGNAAVSDAAVFDAESFSVDEIPESFAALRKSLKAKGDPTGSPLPGVQDKISTDRISLPVKLGARKSKASYILKFGSNEFPDVVRNEFTCLQLAKKCGLEVCDAKIVTDQDGEEALLVTRFDRGWNLKTKTALRFHQEDACQFLDRYPADKYGLTVREIAEGIVSIVEAPQIELLNLIRQLAFSYLIGNGDLHAKNISLLRQGPNAPNRLSPAYDLVCTYLYGDQKMALHLDGKNKNWKRKHFIDFGQRYGLSSQLVETMLDRMLKSFSKVEDRIFDFPAARKRRAQLNSMLKERLAHLS